MGAFIPGFRFSQKEEAMDNLGLILRQEGNLKGPIDWYLRSIDLAPHNTVARQNLAVAYSHQGITDLEMGQYELIIEIDPINPEGYYGLDLHVLHLLPL